MLYLGCMVSCLLLCVCFVGAICLIVFLLYFPAIDANNSGEEEEVESDEDFIYICCWNSYIDEVEEVQGQISQGKPSFDL